MNKCENRRVQPHKCRRMQWGLANSRHRSVHPHACGDNGKPNDYESRHCRFTPTRVGTTWERRRSSSRHTVHPHACGDNAGLDNGDGLPSRFTPTRVGTTFRAIAETCPKIRFTPTRVGTTDGTPRAEVQNGSPPRVWGQRLPPRTAAAARSVHPHACGDNVRGLRDGVWVNRFTPTRVGTTHGLQGFRRR